MTDEETSDDGLKTFEIRWGNLVVGSCKLNQTTLDRINKRGLHINFVWKAQGFGGIFDGIQLDS